MVVMGYEGHCHVEHSTAMPVVTVQVRDFQCDEKGRPLLVVEL
jgi:hypothetical protein